MLLNFSRNRLIGSIQIFIFLKDCEELETLILSTRIVLNDFLFDKVFDIDSIGGILYSNGVQPNDFEVSIKGVKVVSIESHTNLSDFDRLSLHFKNRIVAHMIATTLIPRKIYLSSISTKDLFVLYCFIKKYHQKWSMWFREYMLESGQNNSTTTSLPYGALITSILKYYMIDLSDFLVMDIAGTYDTHVFKSMKYVLVESIKARSLYLKLKRAQLTLQQFFLRK